MKLSDNFFKKVENKTHVDKDTILSLASKLQNGNMKDDALERDRPGRQVVAGLNLTHPLL